MGEGDLMPDRIVHWATRGKLDPGVKQTVLFAVGVLCLVRGLSYVDPPDIPDGLSTLNQIIPLEYWGWAWVIIGAVSTIGAFTSHYRIPFVPTMVISTLWAFSYAAEWAMNFFARGVDSRDYITAASYAVQALLILAVIRLIDPAEVTPRREVKDVD